MKRYSGDDIAEAMAEVLGLTKEARMMSLAKFTELVNKAKASKDCAELKRLKTNSANMVSMAPDKAFRIVMQAMNSIGC